MKILKNDKSFWIAFNTTSHCCHIKLYLVHIIQFESNVDIISSLLHAHWHIFLNWYFYIKQTIDTHVNFVVRLFHSPGYKLLLVNNLYHMENEYKLFILEWTCRNFCHDQKSWWPSTKFFFQWWSEI
jgi:hypothetical protein